LESKANDSNYDSNCASGVLGLPVEPLYYAAVDTLVDTNLILRSQDSAHLPLKGHKITTIKKIEPYSYHWTDPTHQKLHEVYTKLFEPVNETGKWNRSLYSNQGVHTDWVNPSREIAEVDHAYAHPEYSNETGAIECHPNCFFSTSIEGVMGLCPPMAKAGDVVVVLYGGNVPFILREKSGSASSGEPVRYEFVSECFLEGFMDGRAMKENRENNLEAEIFELL
jgi:hypothetical protein